MQVHYQEGCKTEHIVEMPNMMVEQSESELLELRIYQDNSRYLLLRHIPYTHCHMPLY